MTARRNAYLYVASSWRNQYYPSVITMLRGVGAAAGLDSSETHFGVHDFRDEAGSFSWRDIDPDGPAFLGPIDRVRYVEMLRHPEARIGFDRDMAGLVKATACLLVGPCGRSAHLEMGWAAGKGLDTAIYLPEDQEPELMYKMADALLTDVTQLVEWWGNLAGLYDSEVAE